MKLYYNFRRKMQDFTETIVKRHPIFVFLFLFLGAPVLGLGAMSTAVIGITVLMARLLGWD